MILVVELIDLYSLIVLASVVISWTGASYQNPVVRLVNGLTDPLLDPIRRAIPAVGGLDFSPMILLIGLQALKGIVIRGL